MEYYSAVDKMKFAGKSLDLACTISKVSQTQKRSKNHTRFPTYQALPFGLYIFIHKQHSQRQGHLGKFRGNLALSWAMWEEGQAGDSQETKNPGV